MEYRIQTIHIETPETHFLKWRENEREKEREERERERNRGRQIHALKKQRTYFVKCQRLFLIRK